MPLDNPNGLTSRLFNQPLAGLLLSLSVLLVLFAPILYSDYAFLDEAYLLWHKKDGSDYGMFFAQGRWLTGVLVDQLMRGIPAISGLKIVRLFSFLSWVFFLGEFFRLGKKWQQSIGFDKHLLPLGGIYIACSLSLAVYIGWGACFETGLASILGLWSGHLLFGRLVENKERVNMPAMTVLLIIITGFCSLFLYQIAFAAMFIPFALYLIEKRSTASFRIISLGAGAYLFITVLYYLSFIYSLKQAGVVASDRTTISMDIIGKLGFFFSAPLSQAFNFNLLYNMHSVLSQAFPIIMMIAWLAGYLKTDKNQAGKKWGFVSLFIGLCLFIYLPVLVSRENFASYRTMFVLNLTVSFLIIDTALRLIGSAKNKRLFAIVLACCFIGIGFRNFRNNFIDPLKQEYRLIDNYFIRSYTKEMRVIYFLRPAEDLFYKPLGINSFKDEFGVPSTFKDWTPEPLMKQLILERTHDSILAGKTAVIQFTDRAVFEAEEKNKRPDALYVDVEAIFGKPDIQK